MCANLCAYLHDLIVVVNDSALHWYRDDAFRAIEMFDNFEVRAGKFIGVCVSVDNCRLFIGSIPKDKTRDDVLDEMRKVPTEQPTFGCDICTHCVLGMHSIIMCARVCVCAGDGWCAGCYYVFEHNR